MSFIDPIGKSVDQSDSHQNASSEEQKKPPGWAKLRKPTHNAKAAEALKHDVNSELGSADGRRSSVVKKLSRRPLSSPSQTTGTVHNAADPKAVNTDPDARAAEKKKQWVSGPGNEIMGMFGSMYGARIAEIIEPFRDQILESAWEDFCMAETRKERRPSEIFSCIQDALIEQLEGKIPRLNVEVQVYSETKSENSGKTLEGLSKRDLFEKALRGEVARFFPSFDARQVDKKARLLFQQKTGRLPQGTQLSDAKFTIEEMHEVFDAIGELAEQKRIWIAGPGKEVMDMFGRMYGDRIAEIIEPFRDQILKSAWNDFSLQDDPPNNTFHGIQGRIMNWLKGEIPRLNVEVQAYSARKWRNPERTLEGLSMRGLFEKALRGEVARFFPWFNARQVDKKARLLFQQKTGRLPQGTQLSDAKFTIEEMHEVFDAIGELAEQKRIWIAGPGKEVMDMFGRMYGDRIAEIIEPFRDQILKSAWNDFSLQDDPPNNTFHGIQGRIMNWLKGEIPRLKVEVKAYDAMLFRDETWTLEDFSLRDLFEKALRGEVARALPMLNKEERESEALALFQRVTGRAPEEKRLSDADCTIMEMHKVFDEVIQLAKADSAEPGAVIPLTVSDTRPPEVILKEALDRVYYKLSDEEKKHKAEELLQRVAARRLPGQDEELSPANSKEWYKEQVLDEIEELEIQKNACIKKHWPEIMTQLEKRLGKRPVETLKRIVRGELREGVWYLFPRSGPDKKFHIDSWAGSLKSTLVPHSPRLDAEFKLAEQSDKAIKLADYELLEVFEKAFDAELQRAFPKTKRPEQMKEARTLFQKATGRSLDDRTESFADTQTTIAEAYKMLDAIDKIRVRSDYLL